MILAAGRGERMRHYTEHTPKPLLKVGGKALVEYHLEHLSAAGFKEVVINIAYLGDQIREALGDGSRWQLAIQYSEEPEPLETAGAIVHASDLLGEQPFLLINGDIWTDFPLQRLRSHSLDQHLGHLIMVNNPPHNEQGDFSLDRGYLCYKQTVAYTFSGISIIYPRLVLDYPDKRQKFPLSEVLKYDIDHHTLQGEVFHGKWYDIGTPERLHALDRRLSKGL